MIINVNNSKSLIAWQSESLKDDIKLIRKNEIKQQRITTTEMWHIIQETLNTAVENNIIQEKENKTPKSKKNPLETNATLTLCIVLQYQENRNKTFKLYKKKKQNRKQS